MEEIPIPESEERSLGAIIRIVLTSWRDELHHLIQDFANHREGAFITLQVRSDWTQIEITSPNASTVLGKISSEAFHDIRSQELARIVAKAARKYRDIVLEFSSREVLRPHITMPRMRNSVLASALSYEIERISPLSPNEVYWDFSRQTAALEPNLDEVELRILRKDIIDRAVRSCRNNGLYISAIRVEDDARPCNGLSFPVDRKASFRKQIRRYGFLAWTGLLFFLLFGVYFSTVACNETQLELLNEEVANAGVRAARVERLQRQIDEASAYLNFAVRQKQSPLFLETIAELTRIVPDNASITEIALEEGKVRIQGNSSAASDIVALIGNSPRFSNVQFSAPLIRDPTSKMDHFDLSFDLTGKRR